MSLVRFQAKNHLQQVAARGGVDDAIDDRATTPEDFAWFSTLGPFTLDVAAAAHNTKCERYFTFRDNGLRQSWARETVWCNPPYSNIAPWVRKAWDEYACTRGIAMLLPANRTEQSWWQHEVEQVRDRFGSPLKVTFLPGRLRFIKAGSTHVGPNERPPFGCCLLTWNLPVLQPRPEPPHLFSSVEGV